MFIQTHILDGKYLDSVKLMLISKELRKLSGVTEAVAITATVENKDILEATGMLTAEFQNATPGAIYIAVHADLADDAKQAINTAMDWIEHGIPGEHRANSQKTARSLSGALDALPEAKLALISVAGKYAAREAMKALEAGLHVMLFSDNVSLEQELSLKQYAVTNGLLMMGPDCGTAIIDGVPLAFANVVRSGKIGMVSAAGTGLQAVSSEIHNLGGGISQAFGTGGRDGKAEIGGLMLLQCLDYLIQDNDTEVIVLIAKLPHQGVIDQLLKRIQKTTKPVVINFLKQCSLPEYPNLYVTESLTQTAVQAYKLWKADATATPPELKAETTLPMPTSPLRKYLRGLYSGGTLCFEAQGLFAAATGITCESNAPIDAANTMADVWHSSGHSIIDVGADEFTVGRPHPMIDYSLRLKMLEAEAQHKDVAVLLFDVVLGYGAHSAPHLELIPVLKQIKRDTCIVMIASVIGTDLDPQNRMEVVTALRDAGAVVCTGNAEAVALAATVINYVSRNSQ
ncbi:MAG: FdrA [Candidatus Cloacimonetes bacterium HGW-Cloacimonetes-1]|jgi:succinyl-CoA synthetase alpha subunit|nr:MAG: FdrA [Candidatus Cloacimonetes bacterium HGW-Cloacimonetes-1]